MHNKFQTKLVIIAVCLLSSTGCGLITVPLASFGEVAAGPQTRSATLSQAVTKFHKAVYWESAGDAVAFVEPQIQSTFFKKYRNGAETEKVVDIDVKDVTFSEGSEEAYVKVKTKFFEEPTYLVQTRVQTEKWVYHRFDNGWKLANPSMSQREIAAITAKATAADEASEAADREKDSASERNSDSEKDSDIASAK